MRIEPILKDQTCVILAGGPSLFHSGYQEAFKLGLPVIAINDSWRLIENFDRFKVFLYFCDATWWFRSMSQNMRALDGVTSFHDVIYKGNWITGSPDPHFSDHPQVKTVMLTKQRGLEEDSSSLCHGSNSGYQCINLAYHLGAKKIILVGYDMKIDASGMSHWHTNGTKTAHAMQHDLTTTMLPHFESIAEPLREKGIRVYNANPTSALTTFPRFKNFREAYEASNSTLHKYDEGLESQPLDIPGECAFCGDPEENHQTI